MYDRETRFPMEQTMNPARIEYTEKSVMNLESRRCDILAISRSGAILGIVTEFRIPRQFYLDVPKTRISKLGCVLMRINTNNTIEVRFLRLMTESEMERIYVYSTHPAHRDWVVSVRTW
ncbi:hypothetical protein OEG84_20270 [Hoeflea sp. G2-23]|uniref:PilZ domain-containing protein n=1 Tax=Hoeflea algicola TaxID=2983763 RepID=A0ABT3ZEA0_9HYPH|nr:hypothetical protein [Hoeflea algicola]MCY0149971.1 hypothetical protein [Hoeflea algicola]